MKRLATFCVLLIGVGGCARDTPDGLFKRQIDLMHEQADALENDAPEETLAAITTRQHEVEKKIAALKISDDERKGLREQNKDGLERAMERVLAVSIKKLGGK
jgi:hypothetical protein